LSPVRLHPDAADFGAEVIKIENPDGGDDTRLRTRGNRRGKCRLSQLDRNKRGIALDFTNPAALEVARELIARPMWWWRIRAA
jgi:crotonobetainyl-CoA:carnitine CoA-transferase CaiB-like acyl-CoA transferase